MNSVIPFGEAPEFGGIAFSPLKMIKLVNSLVPLGKTAALDAIDAYVRSNAATPITSQRMILVLRCLFEVPQQAGFMRPINQGAPRPPEPMDRRRFPRFPIVIVDDIPLMLVLGYELDGVPESVSQHIDYFRAKGVIRDSPLSPTNRPLDVFAKLESSPECLWTRPYVAPFTFSRGPGRFLIDPRRMGDTGCTISMQRTIVMRQLLRLVASVYPPAREAPGGETPGLPAALEKEWPRISEDVRRIPMRWDTAKMEYVAN